MPRRVLIPCLKIGKQRWNKRMAKVLGILKIVFNYDHLFISGGNARILKMKLDKNVTIENNEDGIKGGAVLWKQEQGKTKKTSQSNKIIKK